MRLHHLALGARDVERLAAFYRERFSLPEVARHAGADGRLRSIWLALGDGVLMVEHVDALRGGTGALDGGIFLAAFAAPPEGLRAFEERLAATGVAIEARTQHTLYFRDPEGNRVAVSDHPLPVPDEHHRKE